MVVNKVLQEQPTCHGACELWAQNGNRWSVAHGTTFATASWRDMRQHAVVGPHKTGNARGQSGQLAVGDFIHAHFLCPSLEKQCKRCSPLR